MRELVAVFSGIVFAWVLIPRFLQIDRGVFQVENYRKAQVQNSTGVWLALTSILATMFLVIWYSEVPVLWFYVLSISFLGLLDDLLVEKAKGLMGHVKALLQGKVTTGTLKLVFILLLSLGLALVFKRSHVYLDAVLTAIFANTVNTLDTRPKRAITFYLTILVITTLFGNTDLFRLYGLAVAGMLFVLYPYEAHEKTMLGDAGSNLLGALMGLSLWQFAPILKLVLIAIGVLWQIFADTYSLTKLLDRLKQK